MSTATKIAFEDFERNQEERVIEARIRHFFETWEPENKNESWRFHADFMMVVRAIHADASKPSTELMSALSQCVMPQFPAYIGEKK